MQLSGNTFLKYHSIDATFQPIGLPGSAKEPDMCSAKYSAQSPTKNSFKDKSLPDPVPFYPYKARNIQNAGKERSKKRLVGGQRYLAKIWCSICETMEGLQLNSLPPFHSTDFPCQTKAKSTFETWAAKPLLSQTQQDSEKLTRATPFHPVKYKM